MLRIVGRKDKLVGFMPQGGGFPDMACHRPGQ